MRLRSHAGRAAETGLSAVAGDATAISADPLGARLIDGGAITAADAVRIAAHQRRTGSTFAEAALDLGLVAPETINRIGAERSQPGLVRVEDSRLSPALVAAFDPDSPLAQRLRPVRSHLFAPATLGRPDAPVLIVAGVGSEDTAGIAGNLAVLVAQLGYRGLLVDANFAAPAQHNLFGVSNADGTTGMLLNGSARDAVVIATAIPSLDLMPAGPPIGAINETVERAALVQLLRGLRHGHRFVIVDAGSPPPDLLASLARGSDGALLVAERGRSPVAQLRATIERLEANDVDVVGSILAR